MFELYRRDGHSKEKVFDGDDLEDIALLSLEKSGKDPEDLLDWEMIDDG